METKTSAWTGQQFRNRLTVLSHAAVIMTLVTVWLIQLIDVLQPLFIALGIYFVLKPGADALSKKGFPIMLSYITMLMLAILIVLSAGFFAYQQADNFLSDEERMDKYTLLLDERWSDLKEMPLVGKSLLDAGATVDGTLDEDLASMGLLDEGSGISEALNGLLSSVGMFFITGITVLFFLLFIIFEASLLPGRIERAYPGGASERVHMIRDQIEASVNTYVVVKTGVGFGTGVCAGLVMLVFGIDLWFTWALLTFLLNYVPYIGSLLATIPPILLVAKHFGYITEAKPDTVDFVSVGGPNPTTGCTDFGIETVHVAVVGEDDVGSLADEEAFSTRVFTGGLFPSAQFLVEHPRVNDHAIAEHQVAFLSGDT